MQRRSRNTRLRTGPGKVVEMNQKHASVLKDAPLIPAQKQIVLLATLAVMLVALLWAGLTPTAWATEAAKPQGTVTLQIAFGVDYSGAPQLAVNKTYPYYQDATVEDLLQAAVEAGDLGGYALGEWGFVDSFTKAGETEKYANNGDLFWMWYENGSSEGVGAQSTIATEKLQNGTVYQFAYERTTYYAPNWEKASAPTSSTVQAGEGQPAGTATLQIVHGVSWPDSPNMVVSKTYPFAQGATIKDLLDAAVKAGDLGAFALGQYDTIESFTKANETTAIANSGDLFWMWYENGSMDGVGYTTTISTEELKDATSYQFAYETWQYLSPKWSLAPAPATGEKEAGDAPVQPEEPQQDQGTTNEEPAHTASTIDIAKACALYNSIKTQMSSASSTFWETMPEWSAMDLAAAGAAANANKDAVYAAAVAAFNQPDATNLQRSIIALSALGQNAAAFEYEGTTYNLVEKMFTSDVAWSTPISKSFMLLATKSGSYQVPAHAKTTPEALIAELATAQYADGSFGYRDQEADLDTTALIYPGLAAYSENAQAAAVAQKTLNALKTMQLPDGSFGYEVGNAASSNVNSTAVVVIALAAAGLNPATVWATESGATPLSALLSFANSENTDFVTSGSQIFATEQGMRALAAYFGYRNTGATFNVYTQAASGKECIDCANATSDSSAQADTDPTAGSDTVNSGADTKDSSADTNANQASSASSSSSSAAQTGSAAKSQVASTIAKTADETPLSALACILLLSGVATVALYRKVEAE